MQVLQNIPSSRKYIGLTMDNGMLVKSLRIQYGDVKQLYENNNFKMYKSFNEQLANFFITKNIFKI